MSAQVKETFTKTGTESTAGADGTLAELRNSVTEIAKDISRVAEARARAAQDVAEKGTATLRRGIRQQPVLALGIAALAGAVLAVAVVPRGSRSRASRWDSWVPNMPHMPSVTRADLYEFADNLQRSVARTASNVPLTSTLERLADAVTRMDQGAGVSTALEKVGSWMQKVQAAATPKKG
jgi:hypothetical protein